MDDQTVEAEVTSVEKWRATKTNMTMALGTLGTAGIIDVAAHGGPGGMFFGALATFIVARHGDDIAQFARRAIPQELIDFVKDRVACARVQAEEEEEEEVAQPKDARREEDHVDSSAQKQEEEHIAPPVTPSQENTGKPFVYPKFRLPETGIPLLRRMNQQRKLYFGQESKSVYLSIDEMYHVMDVARTGGGKSNRFRFGMMQAVTLADTYYINPIAAPVKPVLDDRKIEVWEPIFERLANKHPVQEPEEIERLLKGLVKLIGRRNQMEQDRDFSWTERPVFVFIDELPEVFARFSETPDYLDRIARMGRQFRVFLWIATQTLQVQDIGLSTASQAQFKTILYGGGDHTSQNRVLGKVSFNRDDFLDFHGAGLSFLKTDGYKGDIVVRSPLLTNETLFAYFGLPPFNLHAWLTPKSQQPVQRLPELEDLSLSPMDAHHSISHARGAGESERGQIPVKALQQVGETGEMQHGIGESFTVSPEDEIAILDAAFQVQQSGNPVTREAIKAWLGWNNKKHDIVKAVCDKRGIAMR